MESEENFIIMQWNRYYNWIFYLLVGTASFKVLLSNPYGFERCPIWGIDDVLDQSGIDMAFALNEIRSKNLIKNMVFIYQFP